VPQARRYVDQAGAVLFIAGRLLGWSVRGLGILTGLDAEQPHLRLSPAWIVCAGIAGAAVLLSWGTYLYLQPCPGKPRTDPAVVKVAGWVLLMAAVAAVLLIAFVDINHTSLHRYYRDRLASAYATIRNGEDPLPAGDATLSTLAGANPELVICAAANCNAGGDLPPGRGAVSFTFTGASIGLSTQPVAAHADPGHRASTTEYETFLRRFTLLDAVAVSGAAIAPVMGKMTQPTKRVLFALGSIRLGVWMPAPQRITEGPAWPSWLPSWVRRPLSWGGDEFEAYRAMGQATAEALLQEVPASTQARPLEAVR
jgi:hypothetical protein